MLRHIGFSLMLALAMGAGASHVQALEPALEGVDDWLYILQPDTITPSQIAATAFDLVVMDNSADGTPNGEFSADAITTIKESGKVVLAYLSIGEAENYRWYWDPAWDDEAPLGEPDADAPAWLGPVDPNWEGNYFVRYWHQAWQDILFGTASGANGSSLDRIIDQGFDGVYLDIIDAFQFWSTSDGGNELTRLQARQHMKDLVAALRTYARTTRGASDFLVFPQNGEDIIYDDDDQVDALGDAWLGLCAGIGAEDVWFNETTPQPGAEVTWRTTLLDLFRSRGNTRLVLSVDYVWDESAPLSQGNKDRYNAYHGAARGKHYISYAATTDRALDAVVTREIGDGFLHAQPRHDVPSLLVK